MKKNISGIAILASLLISSAAMAANVDEQGRRCNIEKDSLTNPSHEEGAECLKLRAMLGLPEPPVVNNYIAPSSTDIRRVFDQSSGRWCSIYPDGSKRCD